jgi:hypothetical protein
LITVNPGGGQTLASNLQIVQWQTRQRKRNRLEFLVPWWDLQHGVSINQFLSAFASKNSEFRFEALQNQFDGRNFHSRWLLHSLALMIFALKCVQHEIGKMKENEGGLLPNAVIYLNQRSIFLYVGVGHLLSFFLVERMKML